MDINTIFESKYLKSSDLQGRAARVKIQDVVSEKVGDDIKVVLYFAGKQKGMICNRTNCMTLAEVWGPQTDNWRGADIEIFSMKVPFQGKLTDGLRVRPLNTRPAPAPAVRVAQPSREGFQIAPNSRDRALAPQTPFDDGYRGDEAPAPAPAPPPAPTAAGGGGYADLDDEIPF